MIDEKKLIKEIADFKRCQKSENCDYLTGYISALSAVEGMIAEQPKVGEWIPCRERLPEKDGAYLCWCKGSLYACACIRKFAKDLYSIDKLDFKKESGAGFYYFESDWGYSKDTDVVAWMPLPTPYREKVE